MPRGDKRLVLDNFLGGVNVRDDPVDLDVNESPDILDFVLYGEGGAIVQRNGDSVLSNLAASSTTSPGGVVLPLLRLFYVRGIYNASEHNRIIALTGTGDIVSDTTGAGTGPMTHFDPGPASGWSDMAEFVEAPISGGQGPIYYRTFDGAADVYRYTSALAAGGVWTASAGSIPTAKWFLYHGNRVWAFGIPGRTPFSTTLDSRVTWSELGDPRNWPTANTMQLSPGDGHQFTGGGAVGDVLVLFKRTKAWVVYDLDTGANRGLGEDVGAVSMDTVCTTPVGLFFIDPARGPMVTDGAATKPLDNGTKAPWADFTQAVYHDDHIYCRRGTTDLWDYDIRTRSWWRHNYSAAFLVVAPVSNVVANPSLNVGVYAARAGSAQANIDELFVSGDTTYISGSTVTPYWDSSHLALGAPSERKRLRRLAVVGSGNASVKLKLEVGGSFSTLKTGAIDAPGLIVPTPGVARAPALEVIKSSGSSLRLDQLVLDYSVRQR